MFRTVAGALGPWLSRIPDGETGERRRWIYFQRLMLERHPAMEPDPTIPPFALRQWDGKLLREMTLLRFRPAVDPDGVTFETGYAAAARASYAIFRAMRGAGAIPSGVRFQVCLPTPMASAYMYVSPAARAAYLPAYERALVQALQDIISGIPAADLAIQWDVCQEVLVCEGFFPDRPAEYEAQIAGELARLGQAVPDGVEMGYHLCYHPRTSISSCRATRPSWSPSPTASAARWHDASTSCTCRFRRTARTPRTSSRSPVSGDSTSQPSTWA